MQPLIFGLIREVLRVAAAEGVRPLGFQGYDPDAFAGGDPQAMRGSLLANCAFKQRSAKKHSGYWRDLAVRKRPTDITAQLAPVRACAARHGLPMLLVDHLLAQVARIERGEAGLGLHLVEEMLVQVDDHYDDFSPREANGHPAQTAAPPRRAS